MFKEIHLASKDIAKIYSDEMFIPKILSYPFWYVVLIINITVRKCFKK